MTKQNKLVTYQICNLVESGIENAFVTGGRIKDAPSYAVRKDTNNQLWILDHIKTGSYILRHRLKRHCELYARELSNRNIIELIQCQLWREYHNEIASSDHFISYADFLKLR